MNTPCQRQKFSESLQMAPELMMSFTIAKTQISMYPWNMEKNIATKSLAAMAHDGRLKLIRKLIQAGDSGMIAGDIVKFADIGATTASAQLQVLANAGLVQSKRDGRHVRYIANYKTLRDLLAFLMFDCCSGNEKICQPLNEVYQK